MKLIMTFIIQQHIIERVFSRSYGASDGQMFEEINLSIYPYNMTICKEMAIYMLVVIIYIKQINLSTGSIYNCSTNINMAYAFGAAISGNKIYIANYNYLYIDFN